MNMTISLNLQCLPPNPHVAEFSSRRIVHALRRPILELAAEHPREVTDYFLELLKVTLGVYGSILAELDATKGVHG